MKRIGTLFIFVSIIFCLSATTSSIYPVTEYGAKGDGKTLDTQAVQSAIDEAAKNGGGIVLFPPGQYVSGTIILKDYVVLRLETGAMLLGSLDLEDYPEDLGKLILNEPYIWRAPFIYASDAKYIGIEGNGIIDGRGFRENFPPFPRENKRPGLIRFNNCKFVTIKDITMRNPACWTLHLKKCEDVIVNNIHMHSHANRNNDGIDIDDCRRVSITGCNINTEDDAIVLKSFTKTSSSDIIIADCILSSTCSAIKIGTETIGDFSNISISNCVIYGSRGINLFSVDGSNINNVTISNIAMRNTKSAIQLRLGARLRPYPYLMPKDEHPTHAGTLKNIMIDNVQAVIDHNQSTTGMDNSQNFICGIPGHHIQNVCLSNIYISFYGNGTVKQAQREIPEEIRAYPKSGMFGDLPAYGFYVRHVDGIKMHNVHLDVLNEDLRPAIMFDQVSDIDMFGCLLEGSGSVEPLIKLNKVNDVIIRDCRLKNKIRTFVGVSGKDSKDIILKENFLSKAKTVFTTEKEVKSDAVKEVGTIQ